MGIGEGGRCCSVRHAYALCYEKSAQTSSLYLYDAIYSRLDKQLIHSLRSQGVVVHYPEKKRQLDCIETRYGYAIHDAELLLAKQGVDIELSSTDAYAAPLASLSMFAHQTKVYQSFQMPEAFKAYDVRAYQKELIAQLTLLRFTDDEVMAMIREEDIFMPCTIM